MGQRQLQVKQTLSEFITSVLRVTRVKGSKGRPVWEGPTKEDDKEFSAETRRMSRIYPADEGVEKAVQAEKTACWKTWIPDRRVHLRARRQTTKAE